jgi:hypothetical protein
VSEDNQLLEIRHRVSIQHWRSGHGTHNAGVEGSIPSLSTNYYWSLPTTSVTKYSGHIGKAVSIPAATII